MQMLKVVLYQFSINISKIHNYRKNQSYTTDGLTAFAIRGWLSFRIHKNKFVVLKIVSIHRCKLMRGLYMTETGIVSFLFPFRFGDYCYTSILLYATNQALVALGTELKINFAHVA